MIIDCISDLHGSYPGNDGIPALEGGDLLIIAGDLTARDDDEEHSQCYCWLAEQDYKRIIVIAGNHDSAIQEELYYYCCPDSNIIYLEDAWTEFEGLKIWGSPWTKRFEGMNPFCMAFTCKSDAELLDKWRLIPSNIDILITHSPPFSILDRSRNDYRCGSLTLLNEVRERIKPKLHVFGHIHEEGGNRHKERWYPALSDLEKDTSVQIPETLFVNAALMDEYYIPVHKPVRVEL